MDGLGPVRPSVLREHLLVHYFIPWRKGPENIVQVLANEVRTGYMYTNIMETEVNISAIKYIIWHVGLKGRKPQIEKPKENGIEL